MKKVLTILLTSILLLNVTGCGAEKKSDAQKFKEEYEVLNNTLSGDNTVRELNIKEDNPIVYLNIKDAPKVIKEETAIIYFGFAKCPWCRSVLETLFDVASDLEIDKIYYVDVMNERDKMAVNESGEITTVEKASKAYYELLTLLDEHLDNYIVYDKDGNSYDTGEKRIFAPNVVAVKDGQVLGLETGISCLQENAYQELTEEMKKETYEAFKCLLESTLDTKETCPINKSC